MPGWHRTTQTWSCPSDILSQQVFFAERDRNPAPEIGDVSMDGWD